LSKSNKTIEFTFERTIPAPQTEVFDAWLDPKVPGNPWHIAEKFILDPKVDGLFYWGTASGVSHYGRFTRVERPDHLQHTWMSRNTLGEESTVVVTFEEQGENTLMRLVHSGLPDTDGGRGHEKGWNWFLSAFAEQLGNGSSGK
jgi:uncharacterized protein YndB with AHSA1/START domain